MPRIFDASHITKRRSDRAIAGSFLSRLNPPNASPQQGSGPLLGIYDSSIMNAVKSGHSTQYTRYPNCVTISPGCPCPITVVSNYIPGSVSNIIFEVGSIIVSWNPPINNKGHIFYRVTPYLNGIAQPSITTTNTRYRFTNLQEWQPYTFTVCAINTTSDGPIVPSSSYFLAPPETLSTIMSGSSSSVTPEPSLKYVINAGIDNMLQYIASNNMGPTRGSRYMYVWVTSVVGAWNWVRSESRINGVHDTWNWDSKLANPLSNNDSIIWLCSVIDYITPFFISNYKTIYNCPDNVVNRVKIDGDWNTWQSAWQTWYNYRQNDGFETATTTQPTTTANWNETIIVDDTTVNNISEFPEPSKWTRLTVNNKKQNYLTYTWGNILSSCLTDDDELNIKNSVTPSTGLSRDAEIDAVKEYTASLTDLQKIIAELWAGGPGTVSPPLMFIWLWKEYIRILPDISCPNIIYSLQDLAIHLFEGGRVTWKLKAAFMEARPIQEIRRRYTGQQIASWNGTIDGSQWTPYQETNFITPPFADFPSGHSHFSKAFALTMNKWFDADIAKVPTFYDLQKLICPLFTVNESNLYGDFRILSGNSRIQPGVVPSVPITISFSSWDEMAEQVGFSRIYGGIHALTAHQSSKQAAIQVDEVINSSWNILKE